MAKDDTPHSMRDQLSAALRRAQEKLSDSSPEFTALEVLKNELGLGPAPKTAEPTKQNASFVSGQRQIPAAAGPLWLWMDRAKPGDQYVILGRNGSTRATTAARAANKNITTRSCFVVPYDLESPTAFAATIVTILPDDTTPDAGTAGDGNAG